MKCYVNYSVFWAGMDLARKLWNVQVMHLNSMISSFWSSLWVVSFGSGICMAIVTYLLWVYFGSVVQFSVYCIIICCMHATNGFQLSISNFLTLNMLSWRIQLSILETYTASLLFLLLDLGVLSNKFVKLIFIFY